MSIAIKVCGITHEEEALALEEMGVDYLGFNFHEKSKRYISPEDAANIIKKLKRATSVGIFVDRDPSDLQSIKNISGIQMAQVHGRETGEYCSKLDIPYIKAIGVEKGAFTQNPDDFSPKFFLFDTKTHNSFGGTGESFDWTVLKNWRGDKPFFIAGGLGPGNIKEALSAARPGGADLNSGVETSPGSKDLDKVKTTIEIIKSSEIYY